MKPSEDKQLYLKPGLANQFFKPDFTTPVDTDERIKAAAIQDYYNTIEEFAKLSIPSRLEECKRVNIIFTPSHIAYFDLDDLFNSLLYQSTRL